MAGLASRLGFTHVRIYVREAGMSPLIHARWQGAPVALSLRSGPAGGFSVAFFRGVQPAADDEDGATGSGAEWDEVADTTFGDPELALLLGAAALGHYGLEQAARYSGVPWPETYE